MAGQQGADLALVGGIVQQEQYPALAQHRAQQAGTVVGGGRDGGLGHAERVQEPGERLARRGGLGVHAAQVDSELPVGETGRQNVGGMDGEGGLPQPRLPAHHHHGRMRGITPLHQHAQILQSTPARGEVTEITRQRQRMLTDSPRPRPRSGGRFGPRPADGARTTQPGGVLQLLAHDAVQSQRRHQGLHRAQPRPPRAPALHVRQRPHTDPRPLRQLLLADARSRAQCVQPLAEPVVAHSRGPPGRSGPAGTAYLPAALTGRSMRAALTTGRTSWSTGAVSG